MTMAAKLRRAPLRITTGAFILNSGIKKFSADDEAAKRTHGLAVGTYPFLEKVPPKAFMKLLAAGETALGSALLLPFVSSLTAGTALTGFSGGLLGIYWKTDGMHGEGLDPRPTQQGLPIAKDVWMFGAGSALVIDSIVTPVHNSALRASTRTRAVAKAEAKAARKAANRAAKKARKQAERVRSQAEDLIPG